MKEKVSMSKKEMVIPILKMILFMAVAFGFAFTLFFILSIGSHKNFEEMVKWVPSYWVNHIGLFLAGFVGIWVCSKHQPKGFLPKPSKD